MAAAILTALDATPRRGGNVERILDALGGVAPVDVCIIIDDLHELPAMSAGLELIRDLAARLPAHAHLVLSSREPVPIPLARRRAAGQVEELGVDALAFSEAEVSALAEMLGGDHARCTELAGWPSLVRLVLSAPPGALRQFLWEEVVAGLALADRSGLLALAVLGTGSADELVAVAGEEFDIERLVETVPLLHRDTQGRYGAHDLWADAIERIFPALQTSRGAATGVADAAGTRRDGAHGIGGGAVAGRRDVPRRRHPPRTREPGRAADRHRGTMVGQPASRRHRHAGTPSPRARPSPRRAPG